MSSSSSNKSFSSRDLSTQDLSDYMIQLGSVVINRLASSERAHKPAPYASLDHALSSPQEVDPEEDDTGLDETEDGGPIIPVKSQAELDEELDQMVLCRDIHFLSKSMDKWAGFGDTSSAPSDPATQLREFKRQQRFGPTPTLPVSSTLPVSPTLPTFSYAFSSPSSTFSSASAPFGEISTGFPSLSSGYPYSGDSYSPRRVLAFPQSPRTSLGSL